jgi:preprotein translocase subunit SecG
MSFIIGLLTVVLVLNSLLLALLILIQLPKKEAGAGVAFGGGATDALFGAGQGNALTRLTRHAAIAFLVLSLVLSILITRQWGHRSDAGFGAGAEKAAQSAAQQMPPQGQPPTQPVPAVVPPTGRTNAASVSTQSVEAPLPAPGTNH